MSDNTKIAEYGFTIVELVLSITILGFLMVSVFGVVTYFFTQITRSADITNMTVDSQNLLRTTVENIRYGSGVRQNNTISDPNGPSGGWNTSNTDFIIIIATPAVDSSHNYIIDSNTGYPYNNELVYFKDGSTLMERVLANPSATGNTLLTSCPASLASPTCPPDKELSQDVQSMVFTLYDQNDAVTANPLDARSVKIEVTLSKNTFGGPVNLTDDIRVTFRNQYQ